jgi:hypothetical protein
MTLPIRLPVAGADVGAPLGPGSAKPDTPQNRVFVVKGEQRRDGNGSTPPS